MDTIRVLLAEDHEIVREGTRQLLERAEHLTVVGEAGDGEEAVRLVESLQPDVVVMDVRMPRLTGLEATKLIKARHPRLRVLILSAYEDDQYVFPLLEAGADGYLLKTASGRDLVRAIRTVHEGQKVLDPHVTEKVLSHLSPKQTAYRSHDMAEALTERELEVLRSLASGKSNKEIADSLFISTYTVQVHLRNVFAKLGVGSRTEAVTFGLKQGWITLDGQSN
ncbi:MAG: response regulator transcription factor [Chloroflexi bacterium]|nr:response regulator transcription factor [Chloroflexota bacterium]MDA8218780.1 response regulator transcription factor [Dehalococcoidales bacterium]